jgi:hypothetical protein
MRLDFQRKDEHYLLIRADASGIKERVGGASGPRITSTAASAS